MEDKIVEILKAKLNSVYYDTCDSEYCDDCNRKSMNWGISEYAARGLAREILKATNSVN